MLRTSKIQTTFGTPPGTKILKSMEASRCNRFYHLKAKISDVVPRLGGKPGELIDISGDEVDNPSAASAWKKLFATSDKPKPSRASKKESSEAQIVSRRALKESLQNKIRERRKNELQQRYEIWKQEQRERRNSESDSNKDDDCSQSAIDDDVSVVNQPPEATVESGGCSLNCDDSSDIVGSVPATKENRTFSIGQKTFSNDVNNREPFVFIDPLEESNHGFLFSSTRFRSNSSATEGDGIIVDSGNSNTQSDNDICLSLRLSPAISRSNTETEEERNIVQARQLLGDVGTDADDQMVNTQSILDICSGQFVTSNDIDRTLMNASPYSSSSSSAMQRTTTPRDVSNNDVTEYPSAKVTFFLDNNDDDDSTSNLEARIPRKKVSRIIDSDEEEETETCVNTGDAVRPSDEDDDSQHRAESNDGIEEDESDEDNRNSDDDEDDEDDDNDSTGDEESADKPDYVNEELAFERERLKENKFVGIDGRLRQEFFEDEAELSGSDAGDDDENNDDGGDDYEFEPADLEQLPSEHELRKEVGRIHLKKILEEDERKLLLYKEAYIHDNAPKSDLAEKRFKWRREETNEEFLQDARQENTADSDDEKDTVHPSISDPIEWLRYRGAELLEADTSAEESGIIANVKIVKSQRHVIKRFSSERNEDSNSKQEWLSDVLGPSFNFSAGNSFLQRTKSDLSLKKKLQSDSTFNSIDVAKSLYVSEERVESAKREREEDYSKRVTKKIKIKSMPDSCPSIFEFMDK